MNLGTAALGSKMPSAAVRFAIVPFTRAEQSTACGISPFWRTRASCRQSSARRFCGVTIAKPAQIFVSTQNQPALATPALKVNYEYQQLIVIADFYCTFDAN